MRSKWPGRYSTCQLSSAPISLRVDAAARTSPFCFAQLVDLRAHRKVLEVGQIAPTLAALHTTQLFGGLSRSRQIFRGNRLAVQFLGEVQQHLRNVFDRTAAVSARTVIPLLVTLQLQLHAKQLDLQRCSLLLCYGASLDTLFLFFCVPLLLIALLEQRKHHQLQRVLVAGQFSRVRSKVTHLVG